MSRIAPLAALLALSGCGYFNTMYNAQRAFTDAEKAAARGDAATAQASYRSSIEKANKHLAKRPNSRWRAQARLISGKAHVALGNWQEAEEAFASIAAESAADRRSANNARVYLGVVAAASGRTEDALGRLNEVLSARDIDPRTAALGYLTRARLHAGRADFSAAAADLARAEEGGEVARMEAALLRARLAVLQGDSTQLATALTQLFSDRAGQRFADSLQQLLRLAEQRMGSRVVRGTLVAAERAEWERGARDSLIFLRAELRVAAGDTAGGTAELQQLAASASGMSADLARLRAARLRLVRASTMEEVNAARVILLPAIGFEPARVLIQATKSIEVLLEKANRMGRPLALFAAAEMARDELGAPVFAARLFLAYADVAPQTVWAPKALLAALPLLDQAAAAPLRQRLALVSGNPYADAALGRSPDERAFEDAEDRLARALGPIRVEALAEALQRDNAVTRAAAVIDSLRLAARTDSTRVSCGILVDSLAVAGIRADSIRAACMRFDRARIGALLRMDTLLLRDSTRARADSARAKRPKADTSFWQ